MRTTLTIDADVAAALERLRKSRRTSLKVLVNAALRCGVKELTSQKPHKPYRTRSVSLGRPKLANLDNVADVLAYAEGEDFK